MNFVATEPDKCVDIRMGESGAAAVPALTIVETFLNTVQKHGNRNAMGQKKKINVIFIFSLFFFLFFLFILFLILIF